MNVVEAIILGIIQGATEFLPISSSGHLLLIPSLLSIEEPNINAIAMAHQGTLLAVILYFRSDLWRILTSVIRGIRERKPLANADSRLGWYIAAGSVPAVIAGALFNSMLEKAISEPAIAAVLLIINGGILVLGERVLRGTKGVYDLALGDTMAVGLAQVLALLPGISRSGVTISAGLGRGMERPSAARFSFLLGVPVIAGAGLVAAYELLRSPTAGDQLLALGITFFTAFLVGYLCIYFLLRWDKHHTLYIFAVYSVLAGALYLVVAQL